MSLILLLIGLIYNLNTLNAICDDHYTLTCPHGDKISVPVCGSCPFDREICDHGFLRDPVKNKCHLPAICDRNEWTRRANDGCTAGPWQEGDHKDACDMHDLCYAAGVDQETCDDQFQINVAEVADASSASIMANAVRLHDGSGSINYGKWNCAPLSVYNIKASNLFDDDGDGDSDPLVNIRICSISNNKCILFATSDYRSNTLDPQWTNFQEFGAYVDPLWTDWIQENKVMIVISFYDHDDLSANDFLGEATLIFDTVSRNECGKTKPWTLSLTKSGSVTFTTRRKCYDPPQLGCKVIHDYPSCKPNCLVNNGGCPNNVNCHQVINRIYRVNGACYQAKTGCYGCLESPNSYPQGLVRLDSCAVISDYPQCGQNCLANYGGCPNGNCHQVRDRVYRVNNKCYQATTTCWGCLDNAASNNPHPSHLNPLSDCKLVHDYPSCKPNCLTNNGHQIENDIYRVNSQCYQATTGCSGCLESPDNSPHDLHSLGQCTDDTSCDALQSEVVFIAPPIPSHSLNPDKYTYDDNDKYYFGIKFTKSDQILFQLITTVFIFIMVFGLIGGWIYCKKRTFAAKGNVYEYKTKIAYADDYDSEQQELNN